MHRCASPISALFAGLNDDPKVASSCQCWALMSLADRFGLEVGEALSAHFEFESSVRSLLQATERQVSKILKPRPQSNTNFIIRSDADNALRNCLIRGPQFFRDEHGSGPAGNNSATKHCQYAEPSCQYRP